MLFINKFLYRGPRFRMEVKIFDPRGTSSYITQPVDYGVATRQFTHQCTTAKILGTTCEVRLQRLSFGGWNTIDTREYD